MNKWLDIAIRFVTGGCVEAFTGAITEHIIPDISKGRLAKLSVKAGGFLVGMYASDKISDYIIGEINDACSQFGEESESDDVDD